MRSPRIISRWFLILTDLHLIGNNKSHVVTQRKGSKCVDALNLSSKASLHMVVLSGPVGLKMKA